MKKATPSPLLKLLEYYANQIISEERLFLLEQEEDEKPDAGGEEPTGLEDLDFGDEGEDMGEEGDVEGLDMGAEGEPGEGIEGEDEEDLGDEGDLGDFDGGGGGGMGGLGGGFGGDAGGPPEGMDEEEGEEDGETEPGETLIPDDPVQTTIDMAVDMLKTTGNSQEILNAVKASIQRNFADFDEAAPVIKGLWDTQQPILRVVARKLIIFIRGV